MDNTVFIDFETYYDTRNGYDLKTISVFEYINSPKFAAFGAAISINGNPAAWVPEGNLREVFGYIDWKNTALVAHNVKFDGGILRWKYGITPKTYVDTVAMSRAVLGCKLASHSLARIAAYFNFEAKGTLRTDGLRILTPQQEAELATYCIHDTELCMNIYEALKRDFPAGEYAAMDWTICCFIEPKLVLDGSVLAEAHEAEKARRSTIFTDIGIDKKTFASNAKFADLLSARGYECPMKRSLKTGKQIPALAVSDTGFIELKNIENPELEALCEARIAAKSTLLETRSLRLLGVSKLGSFPCDLNYSGAVNTHRYSGGGGAGGNFQNFTRGSALRRAVCAAPGFKIAVADFAAIELRIVAWLAREQKLIEILLDRKGDPYSSFATRIYDRQITKADKKERQYGKCAVLGLGYGMGPKKFIFQTRAQVGLIIDQDESERVVGLYRNTYTRIPALWNTLEHYIPYIANGATIKLPGAPFLEIKNHCLYLPSGLRLQYPNLRQVQVGRHTEWIYDAKGEESKLYGGKLLENISQALAGEICKLAITRATEAGITCVGQVHDEVLALFWDHTSAVDNEREVGRLVSLMEQPIPWWPTIKLYAEGGYGQNWLDAKK